MNAKPCCDDFIRKEGKKIAILIDKLSRRIPKTPSF
jgi:hypothetical protein